MKINLPNAWRPRHYQMPAWTYLERGGLHAELIYHRRAGKDDICLNWASVAAHQRKGNYWHLLPEYGQARKAIWDAVDPHTGVRRIDQAFPKALRKGISEQEMKIDFLNDSSWQVGGSDRYDALVGSSPAGIVYSEWALSNPSARAYLRPILLENKGWQVFITTPRGRNHAYTTFKAAEKNPDAFAQKLDATQTGVFDKRQLEAELRNYMSDYGEDYGRSKFEQEYLCSFDAANIGTILARQIGIAEREGRITDECVYDPEGAALEISADIGRRDAATWWFWQPGLRDYAIVDYDAGTGMDAEEWCDRLEARLVKLAVSGKRLGRIWLPHDARAKTFSAKYSAVEIFVRHFGAEHVSIIPESKIPDRVNAARVLTPLVRWNKTACERGLEGLRAWQYEYDQDTKAFGLKPLHDWSSHDGDGFSYGCQIMQLVAPPPEEKRPEPVRGMRMLATGGFCLDETLDELWKSVPRQTRRV